MIFKTSALVKVAILGTISYVLMFISAPLPILFPEFLRLDISDVIGILGGMALGPLAGVMIELIKNMLQFFTGMSTTNGVGEFANFLIGGAFVLTVSFIYRMSKNIKSAIFGLVVGTLSMIIIGCIVNYYIVLPFYSAVMPIEVIIEMGAAINTKIVDKFTFVIWIIAPFNLLKASIISILTLPLYKRTEVILNK